MELFEIEQIIYIKMDLALNNLQRLICHKTQQTKPNQTFKRAWYQYDRTDIKHKRYDNYEN